MNRDLSHLRSMPSLDVPPAPAEDPVSDDFDFEFEDIDIPDTEKLPAVLHQNIMRRMLRNGDRNTLALTSRLC